jgi:hypothetical protein
MYVKVASNGRKKCHYHIIRIETKSIIRLERIADFVIYFPARVTKKRNARL